MICRLCQERQATPSRVRVRDYRCTRCIHATPGGRARDARYTSGEKRRAIVRRSNQRRLHVGRAYYSTARSADEAQRINAHIKERIRELVTRLKNREEAQSPAAR